MLRRSDHQWLAGTFDAVTMGGPIYECTLHFSNFAYEGFHFRNGIAYCIYYFDLCLALIIFILKFMRLSSLVLLK